MLMLMLMLMLMSMAYSIAPSCTELFNLSLTTGVVPTSN